MPNTDIRDPLERALDEAIAGHREPLFEMLMRGSRLPGPRMNTALADRFAMACRAHGVAADSVARAMAQLPSEQAPGATAYEYLPVCGLMALGTRAGAVPATREAHLAVLHDLADDTRYRVRDAVVLALSRAGSSEGDALVRSVSSWMNDYFQASAVLKAMAIDPWLSTIQDARLVAERLDQAFKLARDAPRAAARYPGHKELVSAISKDPAHVAARFGRPIFDVIEGWARCDDPVLRRAVSDLLASKKLAGRFGADLDKIKQALTASLPPVRNPDHNVGPTRQRGRKR